MSNTRYAAHASEMRQVCRSSSFFSQQRHVLGGQQGHAKPQPPDVLPVEVDPPRHKVQQPGADHAAAIVFCAQQDLKAEAEIHDPVQHGADPRLQPGPVFPRHAVVEHNDELIHHHAQEKRPCTVFLAHRRIARGEQQPFFAPPDSRGAPVPQHGQKIKHSRQRQKRQQPICKTKQRDKPPVFLLGPLCVGAPPAVGGGESPAVIRNASGENKAFPATHAGLVCKHIINIPPAV